MYGIVCVTGGRGDPWPRANRPAPERFKNRKNIPDVDAQNRTVDAQHRTLCRRGILAFLMSFLQGRGFVFCQV